MRDKEAIEAERKNLARTLEKQAKAVDHFTELEKQLDTQKVIVLILVHGNPILQALLFRLSSRMSYFLLEKPMKLLRRGLFVLKGKILNCKRSLRLRGRDQTKYASSVYFFGILFIYFSADCSNG